MILISTKNSAEATNDTQPLKTSKGFSYNIQRFSGFNLLCDFVSERIISTGIKLKTKAKKVKVDLKIYSGIDLFKKKAQSLSISSEDLSIKKIPVSSLEFKTEGPIYFKKNEKKKYFAVIPLDFILRTKINLTNIFNLLGETSKDTRGNLSKTIEVPLPPFGTTELSLSDLKLEVDQNGSIQGNLKAYSKINPDSEPLNLHFKGRIILENKRLLITGLETEIEDIFTKDSDISKSFSQSIEELINPIINFHKYEKEGITIGSINLSFSSENIMLELNGKLMPIE